MCTFGKHRRFEGISMSFHNVLQFFNNVHKIAVDVHTIAVHLTRVVGLQVSHSVPQDQGVPMQVKLVKMPQGRTAKPMQAAKRGDPPLPGFALQDNQDDSVSVMGADAAGASVDIATVATLTAVSDNPSVLTVDAPVGMSVQYHGKGPGNANVTLVATWNDGSMGPFTITDPVSVSGGPATNIVITHGPPTVRP
jgi:hypothetical protein